MTAFVGLNLLAGLHKSNHEPTLLLREEKKGKPIYTATMLRNRFNDILKYQLFDIRATPAERRATDKLAVFSVFWTLFQSQLQRFSIPETDLCVDEKLVPLRRRRSFRRYISLNTAKYRRKMWWCCDAKTSYSLSGKIY